LAKTNNKNEDILSRKIEALDLEYQMRYDVAVPQAVAAVASSLALKARHYALHASVAEATAWFQQILSIGFLFQSESLLSTHGAEAGMLGDMEVAISSLKHYVFRLVDAATCHTIDRGSSSRRGLSALKRTEKYRGPIQKFPIAVPIPNDVYIRFPKVEGIRGAISVHPVLFTQGINEQQTIAIAMGSTSLQEDINKEGYRSLLTYFEQFERHHSSNDSEGGINNKFAEWREELEQLGEIIQNSRREKNIEILARSADLCRSMGGGRAISCKSAKDRTSMSVTWEEARILERYHGLPPDEVENVVSILRSAGVRRDNVVKNIGVDKYAFHSIQMRFIPKIYRAPKGTGGAFVT